MSKESKKSKKDKPNQLLKSIGRLDKITTLSALAKRARNWAKLETNPALRKQVEGIANSVESMEEGRQAVMAGLKTLAAANYMPPKKSTSGELKFEPGRQVWIKPKYVETYKEGGYSDNVLANLFIYNVVKGRVFLSVGKPDPNGQTNSPPVAVPKIHVTGKDPLQADA